MRVQFAAYTGPLVPDSQPAAVATFAGPKTFLEMVIFSVAVSVTTQIIIHHIFKPRS